MHIVIFFIWLCDKGDFLFFICNFFYFILTALRDFCLFGFRGILLQCNTGAQFAISISVAKAEGCYRTGLKEMAVITVPQSHLSRWKATSTFKALPGRLWAKRRLACPFSEDRAVGDCLRRTQIGPGHSNPQWPPLNLRQHASISSFITPGLTPSPYLTRAPEHSWLFVW